MMLPTEHDEIGFDIYISVDIVFDAGPRERDELFGKNLSRVQALYSCFDVDFLDDRITLHDENKLHTRFPDLRYYHLSALLPFDGLEYQALQILERSFSDIINYWNYQHAGRTMEWARLEIKTYTAGKRP